MAMAGPWSPLTPQHPELASPGSHFLNPCSSLLPRLTGGELLLLIVKPSLGPLFYHRGCTQGPPGDDTLTSREVWGGDGGTDSKVALGCCLEKVCSRPLPLITWLSLMIIMITIVIIIPNTHNVSVPSTVLVRP